LYFADKSVVVGLIFGVNIDVDVHVANRIAPRGIALFSRQALRRENEIHVLSPSVEADRLSSSDANGQCHGKT
jgi:hypothetical protein